MILLSWFLLLILTLTAYVAPGYLFLLCFRFPNPNRVPNPSFGAWISCSRSLRDERTGCWHMAISISDMASRRDRWLRRSCGLAPGKKRGSGNAAQLQTLAPNDPDLFVETVRYGETRTYLKDIYEIYAIYRQLYGGGR